MYDDLIHGGFSNTAKVLAVLCVVCIIAFVAFSWLTVGVYVSSMFDSELTQEQLDAEIQTKIDEFVADEDRRKKVLEEKFPEGKAEDHVAEIDAELTTQAAKIYVKDAKAGDDKGSLEKYGYPALSISSLLAAAVFGGLTWKYK